MIPAALIFPLLLLILCWHTTGGTSLNAGSPNLLAMKDSDVLLPYTFHVDKLPVDSFFLAIYWYFQGKEVLRYDNSYNVSRPGVSLDLEATSRGDASLTISKVKVADRGVYRGLVIYSPHRHEKQFTLDATCHDPPPTVSVSKKSVVKDEESTLRCTANGFYPADISVTWLMDSKVMDENSVTHEPIKNTDDTYSVMSTLILIPTQTHANYTFTCRVRHVSLAEPLEVDFKLEFPGLSAVSRSDAAFLVPLVVLLLIALIGAGALVMCCTKGDRRSDLNRQPGTDSPQQNLLQEPCVWPAANSGEDQTSILLPTYGDQNREPGTDSPPQNSGQVTREPSAETPADTEEDPPPEETPNLDDGQHQSQHGLYLPFLAYRPSSLRSLREPGNREIAPAKAFGQSFLSAKDAKRGRLIVQRSFSSNDLQAAASPPHLEFSISPSSFSHKDNKTTYTTTITFCVLKDEE